MRASLDVVAIPVRIQDVPYAHIHIGTCAPYNPENLPVSNV
jgi:hypothetical protein